MKARDDAAVLESPSPQHAPDADEVLNGRYRRIEKLGRGGLAEVYRVQDLRDGRTVALKRLIPIEADHTSYTRQQFEAEYYTLRQLQHPSIIEVYDYGVDKQRRPYYTMELLSGQDLAALAPLRWREACELLLSVASSLAVIHSRRLIHRDVSALNVRRTTDGRAKLIDFGGLTEMGVPCAAMGTPPYMSPETVHKQPLDGRVDLYALGALAYYVLTGRHAYPARTIGELKERWLRPPRSVHEFDAKIPKGLSDLVMSLLQPEPLARPQSAAEVMNRLGAVADITVTEELAVQHAYLTKPRLVARDEIVTSIRKRMFEAVRGHRGTLLIEGEAGMGRSRILDACVLEAQLAGAVTARAGASDGTRDFGVARRLVEQLVDAMPELQAATALTAEHARAATAQSVPREQPSRTMLHDELVRVIEQASRACFVVLAVDDVESIDEPSLSLLATVSRQNGGQRPVVALGVDIEADRRGNLALTLLCEDAFRFALPPLDEQATRALLASVFGEVPNLELVATIMHRACGGNPREIMDYAHQLVDSKVARYQGGSWFLAAEPNRIARVLEHASDMEQRLAVLSSDARELAALLALDRDHQLQASDYAEVTEHHDAARVHGALSELLQARLVMTSGQGHRFVRARERRGVISASSDGARRALHLRLAERLRALGSDPIYRMYHLLEAGEARRAGEAMAELLTALVDQRTRRRTAVDLEVAERIVEVAEREQWPLPVLTVYRVNLCLWSRSIGCYFRVIEYAGVAMSALAEYSGLSDYEALAHIEDDQQRLNEAHQRAQRRYERYEGPHPLPPERAIRALATLSMVTAADCYLLARTERFHDIPSLASLAPVAPVLEMSTRLVGVYEKLMRGQLWDGLDGFVEIYERTLTEDPMRQATYPLRSLQVSTVSGICSILARCASADTMAYCEAMVELQPEQAENCRMIYHLACGTAEETEAARKRYEVLALRAGATRDSRLTQLFAYVLLYPLADDLMGLRRTLEGLDEQIEQWPGWKYKRALTYAHERRCRGRVEEGLRVVEESLEELPQAHIDRCPLAEAHVRLLVQAGAQQRARTLGQAHLAAARRLGMPTPWLELALARCAAELGDDAEAQAHWHAAFEVFRQRGIGGIHLGYAYETGARIAFAKGDRTALESQTNACARFYLPGRYPALIAKYERLLQELRIEESLGLVDEPSDVVAASGPALLTLEHCNGREERVSKVLSLLCEQTGARGGVLFGASRELLEPMIKTEPVPEGMSAFAQAFMQACLEACAGATSVEVTAAEDDTRSPSFEDASGARYQPLLLGSLDGEGPVVVGVAMLRPERGSLRPLKPQIAWAVGEALLRSGDVESIVP